MEYNKKKEVNKNMPKKKRISWKNLTPFEAQKMISESKGMSKAKWDKLQKIASRGSGFWKGY